MKQKEDKTKGLLGHFNYFREKLGKHIYVFIVLNFLVGLLDGLGLTMFIPLLSAATDTTNANESLGSLQVVIDFLQSWGIEFTIVNILILMVVLFTFKGVISYFRSIYVTKINLRAAKNLRFQLVDGVEGLSYDGFTKMSVGRIQNHVFHEAWKLIESIKIYMDIIQFGTMLATYAILAAVSNWQFAIMVAIGGYITDFLFKYLSKLIKEYAKKQIGLGNSFNEILVQSVNNFKYLKATNYFPRYKKILRENIELNNHYNLQSSILNSIMVNAREPMIITIIALVIVIQLKVFDGNLASILVSLLLFYRCLGYLVNLQMAIAAFAPASASIESIDTILKEFEENREPLFLDEVSSIAEEIKVNHLGVTFGNLQVLSDINITIPSKTSVAFVGESGAGKTTLANVICGLQRPHSGEVMVGNQSLYASNLNSYRSKIGYITQEPVIFNDTLFNNVSFWAEKTPEALEKFHRVMEMVSLTQFVSELENQEDSKLGNNGILVSGGQKQRISIARELYKDVELLIMDEATSALDSETERHIKDSIDLLHGKFTMIIIAHRLSTIKNVDTVYLLEKGKISAQGNFSELAEKSERFRKMVELQEI